MTMAAALCRLRPASGAAQNVIEFPAHVPINRLSDLQSITLEQ